MAAAPFDDDGNFLGEDWRDPDEERKTAAAVREMLAGTLVDAEAAAAALAWATENGLRPVAKTANGTAVAKIADVVEVLDNTEVFVEDQFFALLETLGLPLGRPDGGSPPARMVDLLTGLIGDRLRAVTQTPHRPVRGQRLADPAMPDLALRFDRTTIVACGCTGDLVLLPAEGQTPIGTGLTITGVATVSDGPGPWVRGILLRFGDRAVLLAVVDGRWRTGVVGAGARLPRPLRANSWLS